MSGPPRCFGSLVRWCAAALLALLALFGLWQLSNSRTYQVFGKLVASVPCTEPLVALTLDDGPTPEGTDPLLELLARHHVRATFFLVGRELDRFPELGRRIVAAGHQLGNHSYTHPRMLLRSQSFVRRELEATDLEIRAAGFEGEILFRPPYGKKLFSLPWYLQQTGRTTLMWNLEPESAPGVGPSEQDQAAYVLDKVTPGSIVLLHAMVDPAGFEKRVLDQILPALQARGYRWVTVAELLAQCRTPA
jgi:peptidoglycan-N-acetylglucosamine deacetylase